MRRLQWSKRGKRPRGSSAAHARAWEHTPGKGRQRPTTDPEGTAHGTPRTHWLSGNCFWDCQARPHHRGRLLTVPTAHHRTLPCHAAFGTGMPTATLALPPPKNVHGPIQPLFICSGNSMFQKASAPPAGSQDREGPEGCSEHSRTRNEPTKRP